MRFAGRFWTCALWHGYRPAISLLVVGLGCVFGMLSFPACVISRAGRISFPLLVPALGITRSGLCHSSDWSYKLACPSSWHNSVLIPGLCPFPRAGGISALVPVLWHNSVGLRLVRTVCVIGCLGSAACDHSCAYNSGADNLSWFLSCPSAYPHKSCCLRVSLITLRAS